MALIANDDDLIIKSFEGNLNVVRDLLLAGAHVNAQRDCDGATALLAASCNGHVEIVKFLLQQNNIDVNIQRKNGGTALYMASRGGHLDVVRALLQHNKVDVNAERDDGTTALDVARFEGHANIVRLLEKYVQEEAESRTLLAKVMTTRRADPVELSSQYINRCITKRKLGSGAFGDVFFCRRSLSTQEVRCQKDQAF
jgi:ankyrin repeat protein